MGMFNILNFEAKCPKCDTIHELEANFRFGYLNLHDYCLGDKIEWDKRKNVLCDLGENLCPRRPKDGNFIGEAYVECELCHRDFWIDIVVKNDVISDFIIRYDKAGYIKEV